MGMKQLKKSVEEIKMSDEMKERIIRNCHLNTTYKREEFIMSNQKHKKITKLVPLAATLCICLVGAVGVSAANELGFFMDIKDWNGAITGTIYEQATNEIEVSVTVKEDEGTVLANIVDANQSPYNEIETMGIKKYQIIDLLGNVLVEGKLDDKVEIIEGKVEFSIPVNELENGDFKLIISEFVGYKKADQALVINGLWECNFTK
ncbi:MAG: hypothetical protein II005_06755 [Turicibacter sp.]|nr:hypothetical protein [Turicibacter sp.]